MDAVRKENLAEQLSKNIVYQFVHDRVQQAAYQSIAEEDKAKIHLNIARILIQKEPEASKKERLFEVVDHFNQAHALLTKQERKEVANLNYLAGVQAKNANAYKPMLNYLSAALQLINKSIWETDYHLAFNINRDYLLALYLLHKVQEAEEFNRKLLKRAKTKLDQVQLYRIQIMSAVEREDNIIALNTARLALGLLGVNLVLDPNPIQMMLKLAQVRWKMRGFISNNVADNLPLLTNPEIEMVFDIFIEIYFTIYEKGTASFVYMVFLAMELQLAYGRPRSAAMWLLSYAIAIVNIYKDIDLAIQYSDIAEKFALATPDKYSVSISHIWRGHLINHWAHHVRESTEYFEKGSQEARESGNVFQHLLGLLGYSLAKSAEAKSLNKTVESYEIAYKNAAARGMEGMSFCFELMYRYYKALGDGTKEKSDRIVYLENKTLTSKSLLEYGTGNKFLSFYYFFQEDFEKSIEYHFKWYAVEEKIRYEPFVAEETAHQSFPFFLPSSTQH